MTFFKHVDKPLLYTIAALFIGGFLILASSSVALSQKNFGTISYYTLRQILMGGIGGSIALLITASIPYRIWKSAAVPLMALSFILLALLFIPQFTFSSGGARRWLQFGPITFQPSEVLKFSFVIYLASWINARRKDVASMSYGFIPFILMLSVVAMFLLMQPDVGTLGTIIATAALMYFLGGGHVAQIFSLGAFGIVLLFFLVRIAPYRLSRILVFFNPGTDPQGIGYQINQALIAIGSGGLFGLGFGKSLQKFHYLPEPIGDSIFAIFAEEMGFLGVMLLVFAFTFLIWRAIRIAKRAPDTFGMLLASGIAISIGLQAFVNMASISGLLPLTGITLPFISYGGTSLIVTMASVGILLNISKQR
jgi:cell division protein FtsW